MDASDHTVSWGRLVEAIDHYVYRGYRYREVPWVVGESSTGDASVRVGRDEYLVGSVEQSFLELMRKGVFIEQELAVAPCFRTTAVEGVPHHEYFVTVGIINNLTYLSDLNDRSRVARMVDHAISFFRRYVHCHVQGADGELVIVSGSSDIELGKYGIRSEGEFRWVYGTGIVEPRLSQAIAYGSRR